MRKKKENIALNSDPTVPKSEALETEREERYEAFTGETATEGLGNRFTTDPKLERSMEFSDGPVAGESLTPPAHTKELDVLGQATTHRKRRQRKPHPRMATRHAAARSSKKI